MNSQPVKELSQKIPGSIDTSNIIVVSYDVHGYENEIETFLFHANEVDKVKICQLREEFEMFVREFMLEEELPLMTFDEWVGIKGIFCIRVVQYRVQPLNTGVSKDYDACCLDN